MVSAPADYPGCPATVEDAIEAGRELRSPRWGLWDAVIAFVLEAVTVTGLGLLGRAFDWSLGVTVVVSTIAGWVALIGWTWFATTRRGNGIVIDLGLRFTRGDVLTGLVGGAAVLAVGLLLGAITAAITGSLQSSAGEVLDELVKAGSAPVVVAFLIMAAVIGPVVEEIFMRGLLFGALRKRGLGTGWTVVITAAVFALMHLEPVRLAMIFAMGVVLGVVRARARSTGASIVTHIVNNGAEVLLVGMTLAGVTP